MREEDYIVKFYKEPGKDLVILNLADVQFNDLFDLFGNRNLTVNTIRRLVEQVKPDLITLTGDQVWGFRTKRSLRFLCKLMDGFHIPWAPVLGNHDCSDRVDKEYTAAHYRKSSSCLFRNGPKGLFGCGNYVINIVLPAADSSAAFSTPIKRAAVTAAKNTISPETSAMTAMTIAFVGVNLRFTALQSPSLLTQTS